MKNWLGLCGLCAGILAGLAGCRLAPAPSSVTTPWQPPQDAQAPSPTWAALRAQHMDFSKPLTLAELADIALQNNPSSRRAWNDARVAAAQVAQARGYFMPTLTGVGTVRTKCGSGTGPADCLCGKLYIQPHDPSGAACRAKLVFRRGQCPSGFGGRPNAGARCADGVGGRAVAAG